MPATHEVTNQVPPLVDVDVTAADPALAAGLAAAGLGVDDDLHALGAAAGSAEIIEAARQANTHSPVLRTHDRTGHRIDEVEFHPAWHTLMDRAVDRRAAGVAVGFGRRRPAASPPRGRVLRVDPGRGRPSVPDLDELRGGSGAAARTGPEAAFEPGLRARTYEFGLRDPATKAGLLAGMSMTEKQGGSDVRLGTTRAVPDGAVDGGYRLTGHKWFTSAPMNDLFLTLAQAPEGLTCFLVPRVLPGGERNAIRLQRLKDKLGNRSNASAEIEYDNAFGYRVGDPGRGVATIISMVTMTRLDCVLGSAGGLRAALSEATHHAAHRVAFGRALIDQPVMTAVLADLTVESWAATLTGLRLAQAVDARAGDPAEAALLRIALPVAKFWVCKRAVPTIAEALECLGGNGYVEESVMPRLLRESPLNGLWEGSGNVTALDALRAMRRSPESVTALLGELDPAVGTDAFYDAALRGVQGPASRSRVRRPGERRPAVRLADRPAVRRVPVTPAGTAGGGRAVLRNPPGHSRGPCTRRTTRGLSGAGHGRRGDTVVGHCLIRAHPLIRPPTPRLAGSTLLLNAVDSARPNSTDPASSEGGGVNRSVDAGWGRPVDPGRLPPPWSHVDHRSAGPAEGVRRPGGRRRSQFHRGARARSSASSVPTARARPPRWSASAACAQRDGGTITVAGFDPAAEDRGLREELGIQLQESRLPEKQTVAEALQLYSSLLPAST